MLIIIDSLNIMSTVELCMSSDHLPKSARVLRAYPGLSKGFHSVVMAIFELFDGHTVLVVSLVTSLLYFVHTFVNYRAVSAAVG